jgi:hypothetical protein
MGINELYKVFNDIDFQANRLLKSKPISIEFLIQFDKLVEDVRPEIVKMDLSEEINASFQELGRIDFEFDPKLSIIQKTINILLLGLYKKRVKSTKRESYFREEILLRKLSFQHIETHLKEN